MKNFILYKLSKKQVFLFFITTFCIQFTQVTQAQTEPNVLWAKRFGDTQLDSGNAVTTDVAKNIYTTGEFVGTTVFGNITLTALNYSAAFVVKTDSFGEVLWAKQFGGVGADGVGGISYGIDIVTDASGNTYTIGSFKRTISFGDFTLVSTEHPSVFVIKQNTSGEVLWASKFADANQEKRTECTAIAMDTEGNIYTVGNFYGGTITFGTINLTKPSQVDHVGFLVKQDSNGNVLSAKIFGETDSVSFDGITTDTYDNIYITGNFRDTISFGDITLNCSNFYNVFVAKVNSVGQTIWAKNFGQGTTSPNHYSGGHNIVIDTENNIYVKGVFNGILNTNTNPISSFGDYASSFVLKMDNLGEIVWVKSFNTTGLVYPRDRMATDDTNNLYIIGSFDNTIYFGGTPFNAEGLGDAYVLKMNNLGDVIWKDKFGSMGYDTTSGIAINVENDLFVIGTFRETVNFGTFSLTSAGGGDVFLLKLSADGLSIEDTEPQKWSVFPNPVKDFLTIEFTDNTEKISIEMFTMLGQKIKTFENLNSTEKIDLSDLKTGIYLLKINHNEANQTIKIKKTIT